LSEKKQAEQDASDNEKNKTLAKLSQEVPELERVAKKRSTTVNSWSDLFDSTDFRTGLKDMAKKIQRTEVIHEESSDSEPEAENLKPKELCERFLTVIEPKDSNPFADDEVFEKQRPAETELVIDEEE
jgi:hypothetical protein